MNVPLTLGHNYLLDDKLVVKVIKPTTRSNASYVVEILGHSIESVERERLKEISSSESE